MVKGLLMASLIAIFTGAIAAQDASKRALEVVPAVDLQRYTGTWYEVARLPNWFQKKCAGEVAAMYTLRDDGTIQVVNRCRKESGELSEAKGEAKLADKTGSNAKLKVRFAPAILSLLPFVWGDYWIIHLAPDYSCAAVGEPSRKYLWILSRTPTMDEAVLQNVLERVKAQGYDLTELKRTRQTEP